MLNHQPLFFPFRQLAFHIGEGGGGVHIEVFAEASRQDVGPAALLLGIPPNVGGGVVEGVDVGKVDAARSRIGNHIALPQTME